jgi:hypothetical protein
MEDPDNVYIGRKGIVFIDGVRFPKEDSIWANPFKKKGDEADVVVDKYREYLVKKLQENPALVEQLLGLEGKTLGCWCKPDRCHGDTLVDLIRVYRKRKELNYEEEIE